MTSASVGSSAVLQQTQSLLVRLKLARSLEVLDDLVRRLESGECQPWRRSNTCSARSKAPGSNAACAPLR